MAENSIPVVPMLARYAMTEAKACCLLETESAPIASDALSQGV